MWHVRQLPSTLSPPATSFRGFVHNLNFVFQSTTNFTALVDFLFTMAEIAALPIANGQSAAPIADAAQPVPGAAPPAPQEPATETLYIQNLNEKIKIPVLKSSLRGLFKSYGEVLDVVAHSNLRMRGQAFVSFESPEIAAKALKEVKGFPLYSRPMVRLYYH